MKSPLKSPSHFMLLFLVVAGSALVLGGEELTPTKPVYLGKPKPADDAPRIVSRGHADDSPRKVEFEESLRGPWTLQGRIFGEAPNGDARALRVGLELVPLGEGRHASQALLSTVSSDDGAYRWEGLLPGQYRVRALPQREDSAHLAVAFDLELPETTESSEQHEQDLKLPYPRTMHGSVSAKDDTPRAGTRVSVSETGLHRGTAVVDAEGRFRVDRVGPGPWKFRVRDKLGASLPIAQVSSKPSSTDSTGIEVAIVTP